MVPMEPELVSLMESTRITVNLQCLRAAALDVPWGGHPQSSAAAVSGEASLLEVPVWKGEEHKGCFPSGNCLWLHSPG